IDGSPKILENLNEKGELTVGDDTEVENIIAEEASEPLRSRLIAAYQNAFRHDEEFRAAIKELYIQSLLQQRIEPEERLASKAKWVASHDRTLGEFLLHEWGKLAGSLWPLRGASTGMVELTLSRTLTTSLLAHAYVPSLDAYVVLGGARFWEDRVLPRTR